MNKEDFEQIIDTQIKIERSLRKENSELRKLNLKYDIVLCQIIENLKKDIHYDIFSDETMMNNIRSLIEEKNF